MRIIEEIREYIERSTDGHKRGDRWSNEEALMLEIMCNIAVTLAKLAEQYEGDEK